MRLSNSRNANFMKTLISKKQLLFFMAVLTVTFCKAQTADEALADQPLSMMEWMLHHMIFIIGGIVFFGALAALAYLIQTMLQVQKIRLLQEHGIEVLEEAKLINQPSLWARFHKWAWSLKPIEQEADIQFEHEFDGIRELDNVLPPWWVATFYASILFGVCYIGYQHFSEYGQSQAEEYKAEVVAAKKSIRSYLAGQANLVDETNVTMLEDPTEIALGESIFKVNCVLCHGTNGEGNQTGPNLTDAYWLHGGGIKNVFKTIKNGVPEKGMIPWKTQLRASEIQRVASFILSLQGSNPPNGKAPQGEIWKAAEVEQVSDELSMN